MLWTEKTKTKTLLNIVDYRMENKMDKLTLKVQKKYDRFSKYYDFFEGSIERNRFGSWRKKLLGGLNGRILEIGVGTGKNLKYYRKDVYVVGIDLSSKMLAKAKEKLGKLKNKNIKLIEMDAQMLKFKDNSFDYVVCTFVLCSVPEPVKVLKEMRRVVKKNGKILMIEHVLSDNFFIAFFQHIHNPITRFLFGFNVNRNTVENVRKAGMKPKYKNLALFDIFKKIEVIKNERR